MLTAAHVTRQEDGVYSTEASTLRWAPGLHPRRIATLLGNGRDLLLQRVEEHNGDVQCWHYKQEGDGAVALVVFND